MALVLKMNLASAQKQMIGDTVINYKLYAVSGETNKPWSKFTPSGSLDFSVSNPQAEELGPGEYLVTITKA